MNTNNHNLRVVAIRLGPDPAKTVEVMGEMVAAHFAITPAVGRIGGGWGYAAEWRLTHVPSGGVVPPLIEPEWPVDQLAYYRILASELESSGLDWSGPDRPDDMDAVRAAYTRAGDRWRAVEAAADARWAAEQGAEAHIAAELHATLRAAGWTEGRA
ncbi:hypothetical protein [Tsukamurella pulmonis]|uniref:hypothetical protein n=1 Tax=Tsukamurella pulmonis TaxID=47312 RepID=UPI001402DFA2|nr:hypothetical protein [Tsukamurella pulmonis]